MRSARPPTENAAAPVASTVLITSDSRVAPAAKRSLDSFARGVEAQPADAAPAFPDRLPLPVSTRSPSRRT